MLPETRNAGSRATGGRDIAAASLRDPHLEALFPGVLVCDDRGALIDADPTARALIDRAADPPALLESLVSPAMEALAADSGAASASVGADDPRLEGIATMGLAGGRTVVVVHLRDPCDSPGVRRLVEQNRIYEAVLTTGPIFVHVYDRAMNSRWSTSSLRPELGHQPSRLLSAAENYSFVHPDDVPAQRLNQGATTSGSEEGIRRIRVKNAEGDWRWLAIISVDLLDDPEVGSVVVHSWDVTDEVLREQEIDAASRRMAALIDTLEEAVVVTSDGRVTFANSRVSEMFPLVGPAEGLIGTAVSELQTAFAATMADPDGFAASTAEIAARGEPVRERLVETAGGRTLEQNFLAIRVEEREASRVWVHRDVTEQLQLRRRQEHLLELERTARRLAEQQATRLRELDELKTEFVATVSHELRTPLSAISSYLELLLDPATHPLTDEQRALASSVERGAERLTRLVNDLLELARLQSGGLEVEREPMDVGAAVTEAIDEVRAALDGATELVATAEPGPAIESDRGRIVQILINLLGNAAKFAEGTVTCEARAEEKAWVIEVTDDGPGIPSEHLGRVFEPFYRGPQEGSGSQGGTGLGLAISARLAELLGGSLSLESSTGSGTVAKLFIPIERTATAGPMPEADG